MTRIIEEHNLNRVVVAACTPITHEPLFRETLIDAGLNKDGSSTTKFGQSTAKAAAAQRLAQAKAKFDSAQTALSKLENEQKFVTTYHTFARAKADRLKVRDVIAKVEQAKNPTVAPSPTSGSQAAIDKHRRRLASESSGGVLADMTRWGEDNWPWAAALLAGLLVQKAGTELNICPLENFGICIDGNVGPQKRTLFKAIKCIAWGGYKWAQIVYFSQIQAGDLACERVTC